jgi:acetaldehyde dehydrogenase (acetylating)
MALRDADLVSVQQARQLAARARAAQETVGGFSQEQVDRIVDAMAAAARGEAERLGRLAHEETGFGSVRDKTKKNLFSAEDVYAYIRPLRTVGVLREDPATRVTEIAAPMGVVAAVVPSTNPTSTAIYKALIAIKSRNGIVLSPHPSARRCIAESARVLQAAAAAAGLPPDALLCLDEVTLEGTQELMRSRDTAVILATGGIGLVRAAYSSGKPAYGVGPGNVPAYVEKTADVARAVKDVIDGKTFDNGTLCSSEQALVCDLSIADAVREEVKKNGGYFLGEAEAAAVARVVVTPQRLANPEIVGRPAPFIAEKAGIKVPADTRVLVAALDGVGRDFPLSIEKLCPVLAFYVVKNWGEGAERCKALLRFGGTGHTMGIHTRDESAISAFGEAMPVFRIIVNTQTSMGATGYTTGLAPSMSLGCGAFAGNITSDNITPLHLMNVKRVARVRPRESQAAPLAATPVPSSREHVSPPELVDFVCEDDVRRAQRAGRVLRVKRGGIVTPAARDQAAGTGVLVFES